MTPLRIPLDPCNPGQFYACCGLLEVAGVSPEVTGQFVCSEDRPRMADFVIQGESAPSLRSILAQLHDLSPVEIDETIEASVRPIRLSLVGRTLDLDWWLDDFADRTTSLKCWAGQVTTHKLFDELPPLIDPTTTAETLMKTARKTKSKFGADPRSAWNALDFGYSPNEQQQDVETYPAVEVLAAIGLQGFRPDATKRTAVRYSLWLEPLPLTVARAAAVAPWDGLPRFDYSFAIEKRGSYKYFTFGKFADRKVYSR